MPTERQLNIILESELEFKTFNQEPMSNKLEDLGKLMKDKAIQVPDEVTDNIKKEASFFSGHNPDEDSTPFRNGYYSGYISGATEYAPWKVQYDELKAQTDLSLAIQRQCTTAAEDTTERMIKERNELKERAEKMEAALMSLKKSGLCNETYELMTEALAWKGKEVGDEKS